MNGPIEFWHVQMPNGSVSTMTLDELDAAFQADAITEQTYVLKQGESTWLTLAALLGLDEPASPTPAPVAVAVPYSSPPGSLDVGPAYSLRPMVSEVSGLDDDTDFGGPQFRSSKKRTAMIAGSIAGVALIAVLVAALGSSSGDAPKVAAASQPPPQPVAAVAPPPVAAEATPAPADRLSDAQKKALSDADKAQAAKQKAKMSAAPPSHRTSGYKSDGKPVFHKGGSKYDPLNSSL
jgi:hypothetical protein